MQQRKDRLLLFGKYFIIHAAAVLITNPVLWFNLELPRHSLSFLQISTLQENRYKTGQNAAVSMRSPVLRGLKTVCFSLSPH